MNKSISLVFIFVTLTMFLSTLVIAAHMDPERWIERGRVSASDINHIHGESVDNAKGWFKYHSRLNYVKGDSHINKVTFNSNIIYKNDDGYKGKLAIGFHNNGRPDVSKYKVDITSNTNSKTVMKVTGRVIDSTKGGINYQNMTVTHFKNSGRILIVADNGDFKLDLN